MGRAAKHVGLNVKSRKICSVVFFMKRNPQLKYYYESNDGCFKKHLQKLVKARGGKWVVIADRSGA